MKKTGSFGSKLFLYYFSIFFLFTISILIFQYHREKKIRVDALDTRLNDMTDLVNNYIRANALAESGDYKLYRLDLQPDTSSLSAHHSDLG